MICQTIRQLTNNQLCQIYLNNWVAQVVELVDTLSWGGSGESRAGSSPALGTNQKTTLFIATQHGIWKMS